MGGLADATVDGDDFQRACQQIHRPSTATLQPLLKLLDKNKETVVPGLRVLYGYLNPDIIPDDDCLDDRATLNDVSFAAACLCNAAQMTNSRNLAHRAVTRDWWPEICRWAVVFAKAAVVADSRSLLRYQTDMLLAVHVAHSIAVSDVQLRTLDVSSALLVVWSGVSASSTLRNEMEAGDSKWIVQIKKDVLDIFSTALLVDSTVDSAVSGASLFIKTDIVVLAKAATKHLIADASFFRDESRDPSTPHGNEGSLSLRILWSLHHNGGAPLQPTEDLILVLLDALRSTALFPRERGSAYANLGLAEICVQLINAACENAGNGTWFAYAIKHGLLQAIANLQPWVDSEKNKGDMSQPRQLLPSGIWKRLVHREVAQSLTQWFEDHSKDVMRVKMADMMDSWAKIKHAAGTWGMVNENLAPRCASTMCSSREKITLRKCAGCGDVLYCSRACQKYDWNAGGHRRLCLVYQRFRIDGKLLAKSEDRWHVQAAARAFLNDCHSPLVERFKLWNGHGTPVLRLDFSKSPMLAFIVSASSLEGAEQELYKWTRVDPGQLYVSLFIQPGAHHYADAVVVPCHQEWVWPGKT